MLTIAVIILIVLLLGGGGYTYRSSGSYGLPGGFALLALILVVLLLTGYL